MNSNSVIGTADTVSLENLPGRCFISHSYADAAAVKNLQHSLPAHVETVVFPRAEPNPNQAVSNDIIPTILECPGLIYLTGGASAGSFWVSFERDYALRAEREVFAFDPDTGTMRRDSSPPLKLALTVMFHSTDEEGVRRLISWMATERHFSIDESSLRTSTGGFTGDVMVAMEEILINGGLVLWLLGAMNTKVADKFYSYEFQDFLVDEAWSDALEEEWRSFLEREYFGENDWQYSGEDEVYNHDGLGGYYSKKDFISDYYNSVDEVFARIDPGLSQEWQLLPWAAPEIIAEGGSVDLTRYRVIDLFQGSAGERFNWNRVDDLIIALYERLLRRNGNHVDTES